MKSTFVLAALLTTIAATVLRPSFNLALTGDDYLSLRRFNYYHALGWKMPQYLLTDYGPQDTYIYLIHKYFSHPAAASYVVSFALRLLAALSFLLPIKFITGKSLYGWLAALFFALTFSGLETTDWSFNAPSYLAITLLNLWLYEWFNRHHLRSFVLLGVTILCQPIRMNFLPLVAISLELARGIANWHVTQWGKLSLRLALILGLAWIIFTFTHIGESTNLRDQAVFSQQYIQSRSEFARGGLRVWLAPVAQIGNVVLPSTLVPFRREDWGLARTFKLIVLPVTAGWIGFALLWKQHTKLLLVAAALWIAFIWQQLMIFTPYPLQPAELLAYLSGGLLLIWAATLVVDYWSAKPIWLGLVIALGLMVFPLVIPWLRNPSVLVPTYGRYLIIPAAGLTWFWILAAAVSHRPLVMLLVGLLIVVHASQSHLYLQRVAAARNYPLATHLRQAIPNMAEFGQADEPVLFYFQGDYQILYHTLLFGFAEIMAYQYHFTDVHHIAATTSWVEVVSATTDGESMRRFVGEAKPVKLNHVYAYQLQDGELIDITNRVRKQLPWR